MKRSIGFARPGGVLDGGQRAACAAARTPSALVHGAPCSTQRRSMSICSGVSFLPLFGGGICSARRRRSRSGRPARSRRACRARSRGRRLELAEGALLGVEPQAGLAGLVVGAVAGEAVVREDRPDVPREVDGLRLRHARRALPSPASPRAPRQRPGPGTPARYVDVLPSVPSPSRRLEIREWPTRSRRPDRTGRRSAFGSSKVYHPGSGAAWESGTRSPRRAENAAIRLAWIMGMSCRRGRTGDRAIVTRSPEGGDRPDPPASDARGPRPPLFQYTDVGRHLEGPPGAVASQRWHPRLRALARMTPDSVGASTPVS